jgi:glycosyltransferase involved in cell wall biosynthesis
MPDDVGEAEQMQSTAPRDLGYQLYLLNRAKQMNSVSVALATYNGQRFIREQLDSLAAQEYLPAELIISDDASSDGTLAIADQFSKTAPFKVRVERHEDRVGYSANFMRAASVCSSDIIAFCDQDDIWSPQKLGCCIDAFQDPDVLLVYHNAEVITETGELLGSLNRYSSAPITPPLSLCPLRRTPFALGFTQLFRRRIIEFSDLWEMSLSCQDLLDPMPHDRWVAFIASVFGSIAYIHKPLAFYRQHNSNLYGWTPSQNFLSKTHYLFANPWHDFYVWGKVYERCAEILEKPRPVLTPIWQERATVAASQYRRLADLYVQRQRLYTSEVFSDRVRAFRLILYNKGYGAKQSWGLGRTALIRDFCIGLPAGFGNLGRSL